MLRFLRKMARNGAVETNITSTINSMEELMYFVWQQRLFNSIVTLDGQPLEVIHPGLRNHEVGPDFFNAKVRYDGVTWAGNVEMHVKASDWYRHHHQDNRAYDSVILHVVLQADAQIHLHDGTELKTVVMHIPNDVMRRYYALCVPAGTSAIDPLFPESVPVDAVSPASATKPLIPGNPSPFTPDSLLYCRPRVTEVPAIVLHDWINALAIQRMLGKMQRVQQVVQTDMKSWEEAFYTILLRSLGSGTNSDAMERLARSLPYSCLLHHRDNLFQLRAMLLGQAGLIDFTTPEGRQLEQEYNFLRNKFSLTPIDPTAWRMSRLRPQATPQCRLDAFAALIWTHPNLLSETLEAKSLDELQRIFSVKGIGKQTVQIVLINAVVPTLLSYHRWQGDDERAEQALALLEQLPAESNRFITQWIEAGIPARSALDTQALLHLSQNYCQPHKCLHCRLGCWLIKHQEK